MKSLKFQCFTFYYIYLDRQRVGNFSTKIAKTAKKVEYGTSSLCCFRSQLPTLSNFVGKRRMKILLNFVEKCHNNVEK